MKVIGVSNFDNESVSDILLKDNLKKPEAGILAAHKNVGQGPLSTYYFMVVPDDFVLHEFEP